MTAQRLDTFHTECEGQSLEDSATILRWWAMYFDRLGQPTDSANCRKIAEEIDGLAIDLRQHLQATLITNSQI